jgi:transcriptional regulator with XRE-family HTH domain
VGMKESEKALRERLGRELRKARLSLNLTQADVAERVETDPETISRFERGAALPSLTRLLDLSEALGTTVGALLGAASPRPSDEFEELRHRLAELAPKDRKVATAVMRAVVEVWKE